MKIYWLIPFVFLSFPELTSQTGTNSNFAFRFYNDNFFYDREYTNFIADGYTLAGHLILPELNWEIAPNWKINAGFESILYWGNNSRPSFRPVFYLDYRLKKHYFRFGSLDRREGHRIIRPLMQFDYRLNPEKTETGMQYIFNSDKGEAEIWLNWDRFIQKNDTIREQILAGLRFQTQIFAEKKWKLSVPVQLMLMHRGGQINLKGPYLEGKNNNMSVLYGGTGLTYIYKLKEQWDLNLFTYYLFHTMNTNNPEELYFRNGKAVFAGVALYKNRMYIKLAYWHGQRFHAPTGEDIFQSVSKRVDKYFDGNSRLEIFKNYVEPLRKLFVFSTGYYHNINKNLQINFYSSVFLQTNKSDIPGYDFLYPLENQLDYEFLVNFTYEIK